ncbi:MAG: hypothetical protein ABIG28_01855 [archaeon]
MRSLVRVQPGTLICNQSSGLAIAGLLEPAGGCSRVQLWTFYIRNKTTNQSK